MPADVKLGEAFIEVSAKLAKVERQLKEFEKDAGKSGHRAGRQFTSGITRALSRIRNKVLIFTFAMAGAIAAIKGFVRSASNLTESINAVNVVFGKAAKTILNFGKNAKRSVGLANSEFNQMSTVTGALLKDTGKPLEEVAQITIALTKRAADLASVYNTDVKDALSAINQAIRGETEAIRRYAGDVTDATIKGFLLAKGINRTVKSLTEQEKRLFRVAVLLEQTKVVQGDFVKTSEEAANAGRILGAIWENYKAIVAAGLLPVLGKLAAKLQNMIDSGRAEELGKAIFLGIKLAIDGIDRLLELIEKIPGAIDKIKKKNLQWELMQWEELVNPSSSLTKGFNVLFQSPEELEHARKRIHEIRTELAVMRHLADQAAVKRGGAAPSSGGTFDPGSLIPGVGSGGPSFGMSAQAQAEERARLRLGAGIAAGGKTLERMEFGANLADNLREIPSITDKIAEGLNNSATSLGAMVANMRSFKDIALTALASIIPLLIGGPFGAFLGGLTGGLAGHSGGTFQSGKKIASFAGGTGGFTVPNGFPNDSFPMLVESGERVKVTPSGRAGDEAKILGQIASSIQAQTMTILGGLERYQGQFDVRQEVDQRAIKVVVENQQRLDSLIR